MRRKVSTKLKPVRWWIKQLDREMSLMVREKGVCAMSDHSSCGGMLQDAHIISRKNFTLRYDPVNHLCLCYRHHIFFAHHEPLDFIIWFQTKYPERFTYLQEARNKIIKRTVEDYKDMLEAIKTRNVKKLYVINTV